MKQLDLSHNWQLKERDSSLSLDDDFASPAGWLPATVPGTVHQALMAAGQIPDPFIGCNELEVQWVGQRDWLYRCDFHCPPDILTTERIALCLDGLDTFATVWLNGQQILASDNMFVPHRLPVKSLLHEGRNRLSILFESAWRRGKEQEALHGPLHVWNGDASRVYVRKAQYHYGWDWGPTLLTAGPWRGLRLEAYEARIADLHSRNEVTPDLQSATLDLSITVEGGESRTGLVVQVALYDPAGERVESALLPLRAGRAQQRFRLERPRLWWPRGYGEQALYRWEVTLQDEGRELDRQQLRLGLRRLQLLQEPLEEEPGSSFLFAVNNVRLFCGGVNWIPADSFTPRVTPEQYRAWLQLVADANMLMVRVWGGGIYEEAPFYEACDELGLLVWQDFMFACGLYPAHESFQRSVRAEAEAVLRRLRHHPSLALWCGNNEDYMLAHSLGRYDPSEEGELAESAFPARALYERLLPELCAALDPTTPYWPGSPFAGSDPNDGSLGDRHTWDVWHGQMAPYQDYPRFAGRFVSEFGMQALPALATIDSFTLPSERYPESRTMDHHNKAEGGPRRLAVYLNDNLRAPADLAGAVYDTQFIQAEALAAAIRGWRRRFAGPGHEAVAGALIWQLNDCWPVTSWAIVDYALRPKAAYYAVKRELAPLVVGLARGEGGGEVWVVNGTVAPVEAELLLAAWTLEGEAVAMEQRPLTLPPNRAIELAPFVPDADLPVVLAARLQVGRSIVSRAALWPEPFKYLALPNPGLEIERGQRHVRLRVTRPAKGVWLSAGDGIHWSDNLVDLLPDDEQQIVAEGLGERALSVRWLSWPGERQARPKMDRPIM